MAQLDALDLTNSLRQRMVDFALDDNFVHDPQLGEITRRAAGGWSVRCVQRRACPRPLHLNLFPTSTPPLINYIQEIR